MNVIPAYCISKDGYIVSGQIFDHICIIYPARHITMRYPVFGRIFDFCEISDIRPDIRVSVGYLARYPVFCRIFGTFSITAHVAYPVKFDPSLHVKLID